MSEQLEKLVTLLKELFQLDQPELDFGFYRVMHAKSAEVTKFLEEDLLPQVKKAFEGYKSADRATMLAELTKLSRGIEDAGMDPSASPKVQALQDQLANEAVDIAALESDVYDHLYRFFRRYYSDGDFLSKRVYKEGVYAIPYEGEEVKLHWANHDQYYIKTSEYLRDYAFRLRPNDEANPMRVHFRLVDAAEGEHGNVKEGSKRVFVLAGEDYIAEQEGPDGKELVIRFEYRPATLGDWPADVRESKKKPPAQKELSQFAEQAVTAAEDESLSGWIKALGVKHTKSDGELADYSRLVAHLHRYTARNTFDYFIHKDLGGFLRRELDFYIKNEVMHLDDIESDTAPRVEQFLSKIKVIRCIASKIIEFLAQLEDFQKRLWLKKKFVTETSWCVRLGIVPDEFLEEIAANEAQRVEWVRLHSIDEFDGDLSTAGYSEPLSVNFLKAHPTLMVDSIHFDQALFSKLIASVGDLDDCVDGIVIQGENFHALSLMQAGFGKRARCVYIDPPYNTGGDGFAYRDGYAHSSWLAMQAGTLPFARDTLMDTGFLFASIDDGEVARLDGLASEVFSERNRVALICHKSRASVSNDLIISGNHNFVVTYASNYSVAFENRGLFGLQPDLDGFSNPDDDPRGPWKLMPTDGPGGAAKGNPHYTFMGVTGYFRYSEQTMTALHDAGELVVRAGSISRKNYLTSAAAKKKQVTTWWDDVGTTASGTKQLMHLFGGSVFSNPKPVGLVERCVRLSTDGGGVVIDYFAGSGTTAHATMNLNREDGFGRKFVLVEMGEHFSSVLLPRIKKVVYTPEWKDGRPMRLATTAEGQRGPRILRVMRLESYEDALNNLVTLEPRGEQQHTLESVDAQGADGFREQYMLRYMLDVETRGSASLLNVGAFTDPTAYNLKVKRPGSDESREVAVDLMETFNWLIGLVVRHMAAPRHYTASFRRDDDKDLPKDAPRRLLLEGKLKEDGEGPWWFRAIEGELRDGRKTLVLWRNRPGGEEVEGLEQDNLVLDEWFKKQGYSSRDREFDLIYVNGTNNLENLKAPDDTWKVRLIEEDFQRLMFDTEGV